MIFLGRTKTCMIWQATTERGGDVIRTMKEWNFFKKYPKRKRNYEKKVPSLFFFVISFSGARRKFFYIPLHLFIHSTTQGFLTWPKNSYFCRIPSAILGSIHGITLSIFSHTINHSKVIGLKGVWNLQNTRESSWETVGNLRRNPWAARKIFYTYFQNYANYSKARRNYSKIREYIG